MRQESNEVGMKSLSPRLMGATSSLPHPDSRLPAPYGVSSQAQKLRRTSALLSRTLLSAFALLLLLLAASASLLALPEPSCLQANSYTSSFHLVLKYINGPPPT